MSTAPEPGGGTAQAIPPHFSASFPDPGPWVGPKPIRSRSRSLDLEHEINSNARIISRTGLCRFSLFPTGIAAFLSNLSNLYK